MFMPRFPSTAYAICVVRAIAIALVLVATSTIYMHPLAYAAGDDSADNSGGDLVILDWGGYEDPTYHQEYIAKYGSPPSFSFFADEEEAFQKIRAGFQADLSHPCALNINKWREAGLIKAIDTTRLSRWGEVIAGLKNISGFQAQGKQWLLPFDWGSTALTYRSDLVAARDANTLQSFADPKYKGKISIPANADEAYSLAYLATGISDWNTASNADFERASQFLREVHKNIRTYWSDGAEIRNLMQSGEIVLAWTWNEVATVLADEGVPVVLNENTKEGKATWVCGYVILNHDDDKDGGDGKADKEEKIYAYLDSLLSHGAGEYLVTDWGYGHANREVMHRYGAEAGFGGLADYVDNTLWQAPLPPLKYQRMIDEFELIKAGF
ncbi:MAG: extracellular solute-binding protein [Proteobacteria bacterium]|nr:extracellular solute-binding protein [Pseudomonadota bacterium]